MAACKWSHVKPFARAGEWNAWQFAQNDTSRRFISEIGEPFAGCCFIEWASNFCRLVPLHNANGFVVFVQKRERVVIQSFQFFDPDGHFHLRGQSNQKKLLRATYMSEETSGRRCLWARAPEQGLY